MRLKVDKLQQVVKNTIEEQKVNELFKTEVSRVLGPSVLIEGNLEQIAKAANDKIDILEKTGLNTQFVFKTSMILRLMEHKSSEVRKFVARVVPQKFLFNLANDTSHSVRCAVARRAPLNLVKEIWKKNPGDDELATIYRRKKLAEAGLPNPKVVDEPFDLYGEKRLGDAVKTNQDSELSDQWYESKAIKFMMDYGHNIEDAWEELTAKRYCSSVKATTGIDVDEKKLFDAIKDQIKSREERALERSALKETIQRLRSQDEERFLLENLEEDDFDDVVELMKYKNSPMEFIKRANYVFSIRDSILGLYFNRELKRTETRTVPGRGILPHREGFRSIDEQALDTYCELWNSRQKLKDVDSQCFLTWSVDPDVLGKIIFNCALR